MLDTILSIDKTLFLQLNRMHFSWLDPIMLFFSYNKIFMGLIVAVILYAGFKRFHKKFIAIFALGILVFGASDIISSRIFKPGFERLRPCHDSTISQSVYLAGKKCWGGKYGFVSSHASNTFGVALFFYLVFRHPFAALLFIQAAIASYSRIYLGKHFPLDILCGAMLGLSIAYVVFRFMAFRFVRPK